MYEWHGFGGTTMWVLWILIVLFLPVIGMILYFLLGRG